MKLYNMFLTTAAQVQQGDYEPTKQHGEIVASFSDKLAIHVSSVHKYDVTDRTFKAVPGSGGVSSAMNEAEGAYTMNWARNIWADALL